MWSNSTVVIIITNNISYLHQICFGQSVLCIIKSLDMRLRPDLRLQVSRLLAVQFSKSWNHIKRAVSLLIRSHLLHTTSVVDTGVTPGYNSDSYPHLPMASECFIYYQALQLNTRRVQRLTVSLHQTTDTLAVDITLHW